MELSGAGEAYRDARKLILRLVYEVEDLARKEGKYDDGRGKITIELFTDLMMQLHKKLSDKAECPF